MDFSINWVLFAITVGLFLTILIVFSQENLDYVAYSLVFSLIAVIATIIILSIESTIPHFDWVTNENLEEISWFLIFLNMIEFKPLLFILGMQIIVVIAEKHKIFQWIAVKSLHITKGYHRRFFYMICIVSTITASLIADVTVAVIFVPLVIRACRIMKINSAPFLYGITITINIGSVLTPFSSSKNILIAEEFGLSFLWFMKNLGIFTVLTLGITLVLLDVLILKKYPPPEEQRRKIFLEIMNPKMVIVSKKHFILNSSYFGLILLGFIFFSEYAALIAFFGSIIMALLNHDSFVEVFREIDLKVIFFFIALFILIGTMELNNTFALLSLIFSKLNMERILLVSLGVLIFSSLFSGLLASNPTAVLLIIILRNLFPTEVPDLILIALFLGLNLGGNLLPQGATCDLMTLNIAKKNGVRYFTYKSLLRWGGMFALIHIVICIFYLVGFSFFI